MKRLSPELGRGCCASTLERDMSDCLAANLESTMMSQWGAGACLDENCLAMHSSDHLLKPSPHASNLKIDL